MHDKVMLTQTHVGDYRRVPLTINDNPFEEMGVGEAYES